MHVSTSRVDRPCWRPELTGYGNRSPVNSGRQLGPSTRVVETGLYSLWKERCVTWCPVTWTVKSGRSLTSQSTHNGSFWTRVFPGWYSQPNKNQIKHKKHKQTGRSLLSIYCQSCARTSVSTLQTKATSTQLRRPLSSWSPHGQQLHASHAVFELILGIRLSDSIILTDSNFTTAPLIRSRLWHFINLFTYLLTYLLTY